MLAVGVVFVILAGVFFVRTQWESLAAGGRLAVLAAGSVLFFGVSALAHKLWKLERTGSAFFILGSAFLPISVWAAGYLDLLGESLSGASNPWLLTISFGIFTVIALLAVRIYRKTAWGVLFLCGLTATYTWLTGAIFTNHAYNLLAFAAYIFVLNLVAKPLVEHLPLPIGKPLPIYAFVMAFISIVPVLTLPNNEASPIFYGIAGLLIAASFLSPTSLKALKGWTALFVCGMTLYGSSKLLQPLTENGVFSLTGSTTAAVSFIFTALCMLMIAAAEKIPEKAAKGFHVAFYLCAGISLLFMFVLSQSEYHWLLLAATGILLAATVLRVLRTDKALPKGFTAAETVMLCIGLSSYFGESLQIGDEPLTHLLVLGLLLLCWIPFHFCKLLHTTFADFIFPISVWIFTIETAFKYDACWQANAAFGIMLFLVLAFWLLATEHRTRTVSQHFFAVFSVISLAAAYSLTYYTTFWKLEDDLFILGWTVLSLGFTFLTYFTTKGKFHSVRKLLFDLFFIPPIVVAFFHGLNDNNTYYALAAILVCAVSCLVVWRIFSAHGMRNRSTLSFVCATVLICEAAANLFRFHVFKDGELFPVMMFASIALLLVGIFSLFIRLRTVRFVGDYAISNTARFLMPVTSVILACSLGGVDHSAWHTLYLLFTLIFCAAGWLSAKRTDTVLPTFCGIASLIALEALRDNTIPYMELTPRLIVWLVGTAVICTLFCGLAIRLKKSQTNRSLSLTITAGCTLIWLLYAHIASYTSKFPIQKEWVAFSFFAILALYLLHFRFLTEKISAKRGMTTFAAAALTIAVWLFPLFDFKDTYLDGKAHLLPLLGFALVVKKLYDKKTGSWTLFFVSIYALLTLGFQAVRSENGSDLLTVLVVSLAIFVVSFFIKKKKWFLLGGISLLCIAFYMNTKIFPEFGWWIFLLLVGVVLIAIAAVNELCKQRGESLKVKAGRFMEDWDW